MIVSQFTRCSMGVGCDEFGVCYADTHGRPEMCPLRQKTTDREDLLTPEQVASILRVSKKTLNGWRYKSTLKGKGPKWVKIGGSSRGKVLYRREDVEEYLSKGGDR